MNDLLTLTPEYRAKIVLARQVFAGYTPPLPEVLFPLMEASRRLLKLGHADDGEFPDFKWLSEIDAPLGILSYEGRNPVIKYDFNGDRVVIRTRGQLRALCRALGIAIGNTSDSIES